MKLHLLKKFEPLFTTRSGITVQQPVAVVQKQNLLMRNNRTGQVMLNGETITETAYKRLLAAIEIYHPRACVYANAYQILFIYPKLVPEW